MISRITRRGLPGVAGEDAAVARLPVPSARAVSRVAITPWSATRRCSAGISGRSAAASRNRCSRHIPCPGCPSSSQDMSAADASAAAGAGAGGASAPRLASVPAAAASCVAITAWSATARCSAGISGRSAAASRNRCSRRIP